jgi:peptidoglycan/LPS O-acetylase OafA/YrhL
VEPRERALVLSPVPLLVRGFLSTCTGERITSAALFVVAGLIAGDGVMRSFPIWLLGASTARFELARRHLPWLTGGLLAEVLVATRAWVWPAEDFVLGIACTLWVLAVVASPRAAEPATHRLWRIGTRTAAFSYSLYAIHLPLVFLARPALGEHMANGGRNQLEPLALVSYTLVLLAIVLLSWGFGHLTEAQPPS